MKGYLFTQAQPDTNATNGERRREIGVIATSRDQAEALLSDAGIEGAELVSSGGDIEDRLRELGMTIGEVKIL